MIADIGGGQRPAVNGQLVQATVKGAGHKYRSRICVEASRLPPDAAPIHVHGQIGAVVCDVCQVPLPVRDVVWRGERPVRRGGEQVELVRRTQDLEIEQGSTQVLVTVRSEVLRGGARRLEPDFDAPSCGAQGEARYLVDLKPAAAHRGVGIASERTLHTLRVGAGVVAKQVAA